MSSPQLSVVVASVNGLRYLDGALAALTTHAPEAEIVVADWTDEATRRHVRSTYPSVKMLSFDQPQTVPELRAAGIAATTAPYVAVIEDHCVIQPGWSAAILETHGNAYSVAGGPIRNGATRRIRDWAAFFCEYNEHMEPLPAGPTRSLPGMNVSYDRRAIESMQPLLDEGRWETFLHPYLLERGFTFYAEPRMLLVHDKDFGFREFSSQRYHYARSHAGMLNDQLGRRRVLYVGGSPLLVPLLYNRIARKVLSRRVHRAQFLGATPLILVYLAIWAFGEAVGYAFGGGRSLLKVK